MSVWSGDGLPALEVRSAVWRFPNSNRTSSARRCVFFGVSGTEKGEWGLRGTKMRHSPEENDGRHIQPKSGPTNTLPSLGPTSLSIHTRRRMRDLLSSKFQSWMKEIIRFPGRTCSPSTLAPEGST